MEVGALATCWVVEGEESTTKIEGPTVGSEGVDIAG